MPHLVATLAAMTRRSMATVWCALLVAAAGCSAPSPSGSSSGTPVDASTATRGPQDFAGLVDVGGGRRLFAQCRGTGWPTVVLISGKGNGADDWTQVLDPADPAHAAPGDDVGAGLGKQHPSDSAVFASVARFTRVCAYDRPDTRIGGADQSTPRPQPHTVDLDVSDLRSLLTALREPEPYVLVAHSYGGLIATLYSRTYPQTVGGLVMVDAATELIGEVISPARLASWNDTNRATSAQAPEGVEVIDAFTKIKAAPPMPALPAVVLTADKPYRTDLLPPEATQGDKLVTFADWLASQDRLAASLGGKHLTQTNSGHHVYLYSPALVTAAVREVVDDVRDRTPPTTG